MWRAALPSRATGPKSEAGYTLIEILFVLAITAFLLVILSEFLFSGMRLWAKNDQAYRRQHQIKLVYQVINKELSTLYINPYLPDKALTGTDIEAEFWKESTAGLVKVKYRYEQTEHILYRSVGFAGTTPSETALFKNIKDWKFEYYQPHTQNWVLEWDPKEKTSVPSLIRISIATKESDLGTFTIPVKAWHSEEEEL